MTFWQMINVGGATVYVLLLLSVLSLAVIIERAVYYQRSARVPREELMAILRDELGKKGFQKALDVCGVVATPLARVAASGITAYQSEPKIVGNAMERQITVETMKFEKRISIVGTIGSTAVYIGLFGTVLGIIKAFQDISEKGTGGVTVVVNGIAEALVCTAVGLCVAVPAVIAYNYFIKKIEDRIKDMELCASETADLLSVKQHV